MTILYQDDCMVVCLKPTGTESEDHGENSVPALLRKETGKEIGAVHRLDKVASGVMVYSLNPAFTGKLTQSFHDTGEKTYLAVVQGNPGEKGEYNDLLYHDPKTNKTFTVKRMRRGVREAKLSFERLSTLLHEGTELSLVRIHLVTGRTHQIRVQFASRGMPLVGDRRYGSAVRNDMVALWSEKIALQHPKTKRHMAFHHAPPEIFPFSLFEILD